MTGFLSRFFFRRMHDNLRKLWESRPLCVDCFLHELSVSPQQQLVTSSRTHVIGVKSLTTRPVWWSMWSSLFNLHVSSNSWTWVLWAFEDRRKKIRKLISFCVLNIVFSIEQHDSMWLRAKKNFNCVNLNAEKKTPAQLKLTHPENSVRIAHEIMKHEKTQLKLRQKGNRQSGRWLTAETNFTHSERTHRMEKNFSLLVGSVEFFSVFCALSPAAS